MNVTGFKHMQVNIMQFLSTNSTEKRNWHNSVRMHLTDIAHSELQQAATQVIHLYCLNTSSPISTAPVHVSH